MRHYAVKHMNITIAGGGNIGTQFAVHCAEKNHRVVIYSSKPECFDERLFIVDEKGVTIHEGNIAEATKDAERAFCDADIIFVTTPAFCMKDMSEQILPYVKKGAKIGLIPGTGGGEWFFRKCIEKGVILFGLQRVPSVARLVEYGKKVCASGYRPELFIATLPHQYQEEIQEFISSIFDKPCVGLPNYLNLTLAPSNPILHTSRLRVLFSDYHEGRIYESVPLFYEEWNDESSELLFKCDDEVQRICRALKEFDLSYVKSLRVHYESKTLEQLTRKISSIQSFKGLKTPTIECGGGYIPDLHSRYFTADFSFGLGILVQIAEFADVEVPCMKETLEWYEQIAVVKKRFCFADFGINNGEKFLTLYRDSKFFANK